MQVLLLKYYSGEESENVIISIENEMYSKFSLRMMLACELAVTQDMKDSTDGSKLHATPSITYNPSRIRENAFTA